MLSLALPHAERQLELGRLEVAGSGGLAPEVAHEVGLEPADGRPRP